MPLAQPTGLGPLPYYSPGTVTDLVNYMITYGWMEAAPPPPAPPSDGVVWEDGTVVWDDEGVVHENT